MRVIFKTILFVIFLIFNSHSFALAQLSPQPEPSLVWLENSGSVVVEAERFNSQTKDDIRKWYLIDQTVSGNHAAGASRGQYLEILPDTRITHDDVLRPGENFSDTPGAMTIVSYNINFQTTGRYYVWPRAYSTGSEDNGVHVGIDGQWPTSGSKIQWCSGKNSWTFSNNKRDSGGGSCGIRGTIYIDVNTPGVHTVQFSMREDGFELDQFLMTTNPSFTPTSSALQPSDTTSGSSSPQPTSSPSSTPISTTSPTPTPTPTGTPVSGSAQISGELRKWHKVSFMFDGPNVSETSSSNPFLNYRFNMIFTSPSGRQVIVPGHFAADGNAANTSATSGNKWRVHFTPDEVGNWRYRASFRTGNNVAVSLDENIGTATSFDGQTGSFYISNTNKSKPDNRAKGRLNYVGKHHLQWAETGEFFVKGGADSPENFLAYNDFDGTQNNDGIDDFRIKDWAPHLQDWRSGDPTWKGDKGKEIIGAINYLSSKGVNAFSFLTMNINGDDKNVFPYISYSTADRVRIDVSKVDQWEIVFNHGTEKGMYLHFKTQETENDQLLDAGALGVVRKLYYRELISRFGHNLALNWNVGEENSNTDSQRKEFAEYIRQVDPYDNHIVVHTYPDQQNLIYTPLLGNGSLYTGISIQNFWSGVFDVTLNWIRNSAQSGKPWVVANDEQGNSSCGVPPDNHTYGSSNCNVDNNLIREKTLWANLMAGGGGVEYYFGYSLNNSDLTAEDFRSRDRTWEYTSHALRFFENYLPFWKMINNNSLTSTTSDYVLELPGEVYAVYLQSGGTTNITLPSGTFEIKWYDPRNGGGLQNGTITQISGGSTKSLGYAPNSINEDWAVLIRKSGYVPTPTPTPTPSPTPTASPTSSPTPNPTTTATATASPTSTATPSPTPTAIGVVCNTDFNSDGTVDLLDRELLLENYFTSQSNFDVNNDSVVDLADYSVLVSEFGKTCSNNSTGSSYLPPTVQDPNLEISEVRILDSANNVVYSNVGSSELTISLAEFTKFRIEAIRSNTDVDSVAFVLNDNEVNVDNNQPFLLDWEYGTGYFVLWMVPYDDSSKGGNVGISEKVILKVN